MSAVYTLIKDIMGLWHGRRRQKELAHNYRRSMHREIQRCIELSHNVIRDEQGIVVSSQAYRLPASIYSQWPDKLDLLDLDEEGLAVIETFYDIVNQINGSLEAAAQGYRAERFEVVMLEGTRNRVNATYLIELGEQALNLLKD